MNCPEDNGAYAGDYVVAVFPGEHDERTCAAGFLTEEGNELAQSIHDPDLIDAVAARLQEIANEIRGQRALPTLGANQGNVVFGVSWGGNTPDTSMPDQLNQGHDGPQAS